MVKLIVLDQIINSMTEFKQIIGRGTRLVWDRDKRFFTIMDFRRATEKFSDPEFDGPATSTYQGDGTKPLPEGIDDEDYSTDDENNDEEVQESIEKYRVNDVSAKIILTTELIYGPDGKLIANQKDNFRTLITDKFSSADEFKEAWLTSNRTEILNDFEENGVDFNRFKDSIGNDIDTYDIIRLVGFDLDARLKKERVESVKDSDIYTSLNKEQQQIVDELLNIYQQQDCLAIEKIDTLNLPNFNPYGGFIPSVKKMGGKAKYNEFITNLINQIYEE